MYVDLRSQAVRISIKLDNLKHTCQYSQNEILMCSCVGVVDVVLRVNACYF